MRPVAPCCGDGEAGFFSAQARVRIGVDPMTVLATISARRTSCAADRRPRALARSSLPPSSSDWLAICATSPRSYRYLAHRPPRLCHLHFASRERGLRSCSSEVSTAASQCRAARCRSRRACGSRSTPCIWAMLGEAEGLLRRSATRTRRSSGHSTGSLSGDPGAHTGLQGARPRCGLRASVDASSRASRAEARARVARQRTSGRPRRFGLKVQRVNTRQEDEAGISDRLPFHDPIVPFSLRELTVQTTVRRLGGKCERWKFSISHNIPDDAPEKPPPGRRRASRTGA